MPSNILELQLLMVNQLNWFGILELYKNDILHHCRNANGKLGQPLTNEWCKQGHNFAVGIATNTFLMQILQQVSLIYKHR